MNARQCGHIRRESTRAIVEESQNSKVKGVAGEPVKRKDPQSADLEYFYEPGTHLTQLITKRKSCGGRPCPRPVPLAGLLGGRTRASAAVQGDRPTSAPSKSWLSQMDTQFLRFPAA